VLIDLRLISSVTQWFVKAVEGIPDVYTITVGQFPPKLGTPGFRREIDSDPNDVISSPLRGHWRFVPVGPHGVFESALPSESCIFY
jgi:hypothetical protein